jgi:hypothetical protein
MYLTLQSRAWHESWLFIHHESMRGLGSHPDELSKEHAAQAKVVLISAM